MSKNRFGWSGASCQIQARSEIPETERDEIRLRVGFEGNDPQPLRETGRRLGLSAERVRQIESRALKRLAMRRELEALREVA